MADPPTAEQLRADADNLDPTGKYWVCGRLKAAEAVETLNQEVSRLRQLNDILKADLQEADADKAALISRVTEALNVGL
jgi:hypothetical protein